MKKLIVAIFVISLCGFNAAFAQTEEEEIPKGLSIGPYFGWSVAGINASDVPNGTKNAVQTAPSPNFGIMGYYPTDFTKNSGFGAMLGFKQIPFAFDYASYKTGFNYTYFIVGLFFNVSGFTIGLDGSFPTKGKEIDSDLELNTDNAATVVDLKLGGLFTLFENKVGATKIFINAGYFMGEQYKTASSTNATPAHVELGLTYLLNTANL